MILTRFFNWIWYSHSPFTWLFWPVFWPLSKLFAQLARANKHNQQAQSGQQPGLSVPVVVVGNITVGGTGKTPMIIALIERLQAQGYRPGVISRGYGAKPDAVPFSVSAQTPPSQGGDEPTLIAKRCGYPVVIDPVRRRGAEYLQEQFPDINVIVSDDGLQHYALERDIELCLVDGSRGLGSGQLMPLGPLREPKARLDSVSFVIVNGQIHTDLAARSPIFSMRIEPGVWCNAKTSSHREHLSGLDHCLAIAAIGNPQRFYQTLSEQGIDFQTRDFADHQTYTAKTID